jgi:hypothetical protein
MNERLPSLAAFNHVIVRAIIDGKVYWLDGTRTGDKSGLDVLRPPPHRWALPDPRRRRRPGGDRSCRRWSAADRGHPALRRLQGPRRAGRPAHDTA